MMRYYFLLFLVAVFLRMQGFCQASSNYEKVIAIDTSKQDGSKKLLLLYNIKETLEHNSQQQDTGYVLALIKIANYENDVHGDASKAITLTTQALQILQTSRWKTPKLRANCCYNLGILYYNIRVYDQAKFFFAQAIEISNAAYLKGFYLDSKFYITVIYDLLGDYEQVEKESQLAMTEAVIEHDTVSFNHLLYLHCRATMFRGDSQSALAEAKQLEESAKHFHDTLSLANAYNLQAKIYDNYKNYVLAEQLYKLAISTRLPLSNNVTTAIEYSDLATFYYSSLHNYQQAESFYKKSIHYGELNPAEVKAKLLLMTYGNLGDMYTSANEFAKAITWYNMALNAVGITVPDFLSVNPSFKQLSVVGEKAQILLTLTSKCELLLKLFNKTKNGSYLKYCINTAITADSLIVQMRHEQTGDKSKLYWRNETHEFFSIAMEACYLSGNTEKAFFLMEKSRSVLLNDKLNEMNSSLAYLPREKVLSENRIVNEIAQLQTNLVSLSFSSPHYTSTLKKLDDKQDELSRYIKSLEKEYPQYYQYKYADDVPAISDIKQYLKDNNQSLVYYFAADSAIYILGLTKSKTTFKKVPVQSFDSRQLAQFTNLCSNRQQNNSNYKVFSSLSYTIYQKIFAPLQLPSGNITVCTDNFFIPFDALCSDSKGKEFLLYKYNFSYTYSARTLLKPFKSNAKPKGDFVGFAPVSFAQPLNVFSLHNSASALQNVANCYGENTVFTNHDASRYHFFQNASHYTILTVFSHAQADTTDKEPVLYMQDSVIRLSELQKLKNPATQFVLLSACQTNTGKNATGEGIYSLARGFASAGIPSVSATLWNANEEVIYSISTKFNEYLSQGMNKSEALTKAKIWYLQNSSREHKLPFYWANMVLIGSSNPIVVSPSNHTFLWLTAALLVVIFIACVPFFRHRKKSFIKTKQTG